MDKTLNADMLSRLGEMARDNGNTWDLSPKDQAAIQYALDRIAELSGDSSSKTDQDGPRQFFWNDLNAGESWHLGSEDDLDAAARSVMHSIRSELDEILIAGDDDRMYSIEVKTMTQAEVDALPDM